MEMFWTLIFTGGALLFEYLAVTHGHAWLAWGAAVFGWLAVFVWTCNRKRRNAVRAIWAVVLTLGTVALLNADGRAKLAAVGEGPIHPDVKEPDASVRDTIPGQEQTKQKLMTDLRDRAKSKQSTDSRSDVLVRADAIPPGPIERANLDFRLWSLGKEISEWAKARVLDEPKESTAGKDADWIARHERWVAQSSRDFRHRFERRVMSVTEELYKYGYDMPVASRAGMLRVSPQIALRISWEFWDVRADLRKGHEGHAE